MEPYLGVKYGLLECGDDFTELITFLQCGFYESILRPSQVLKRNEDGTYSLICQILKMNFVFTPGIAFEEVMPEGDKVKFVITIDGNKLTQVQEINDKTVTDVYDFQPDGLIIKSTAIGFDKEVTKRYGAIPEESYSYNIW